MSFHLRHHSSSDRPKTESLPSLVGEPVSLLWLLTRAWVTLSLCHQKAHHSIGDRQLMSADPWAPFPPLQVSSLLALGSWLYSLWEGCMCFLRLSRASQVSNCLSFQSLKSFTPSSRRKCFNLQEIAAHQACSCKGECRCGKRELRPTRHTESRKGYFLAKFVPSHFHNA